VSARSERSSARHFLEVVGSLAVLAEGFAKIVDKGAPKRLLVGSLAVILLWIPAPSPHIIRRRIRFDEGNQVVGWA
jgi:hypothetical protein